MPGKKTTKKSAPKKAVKETTPPKEETPVVETPAAEETTVKAPTDAEINYDDDFNVLQEQLKDAMTLIKGLVSHVSRP